MQAAYMYDTSSGGSNACLPALACVHASGELAGAPSALMLLCVCGWVGGAMQPHTSSIRALACADVCVCVQRELPLGRGMPLPGAAPCHVPPWDCSTGPQLLAACALLLPSCVCLTHPYRTPPPVGMRTSPDCYASRQRSPLQLRSHSSLLACRLNLQALPGCPRRAHPHPALAAGRPCSSHGAAGGPAGSASGFVRSGGDPPSGRPGRPAPTVQCFGAPAFPVRAAAAAAAALGGAPAAWQPAGCRTRGQPSR